MTQTPEPIDESKEIGEWLALWANGEVRDQNGAFLDKILKQKVDAEAVKRPKPNKGLKTGGSPDGIIKSFVASFAAGEIPDQAFGGSAGAINQMIRRAEADGRAEERELTAATGGGMQITAGEDFGGVLQEQIATLEAQVDKAGAELVRAHEWRFHLEARTREAHATVKHLLEVVKRAPSKDEMEGIVDTLQEAIGWVP